MRGKANDADNKNRGMRCTYVHMHASITSAYYFIFGGDGRAHILNSLQSKQTVSSHSQIDIRLEIIPWGTQEA